MLPRICTKLKDIYPSYYKVSTKLKFYLLLLSCRQTKWVMSTGRWQFNCRTHFIAIAWLVAILVTQKITTTKHTTYWGRLFLHAYTQPIDSKTRHWTRNKDIDATKIVVTNWSWAWEYSSFKELNCNLWQHWRLSKDQDKIQAEMYLS